MLSHVASVLAATLSPLGGEVILFSEKGPEIDLEAARSTPTIGQLNDDERDRLLGLQGWSPSYIASLLAAISSPFGVELSQSNVAGKDIDLEAAHPTSTLARANVNEPDCRENQSRERQNDGVEAGMLEDFNRAAHVRRGSSRLLQGLEAERASREANAEQWFQQEREYKQSDWYRRLSTERKGILEADIAAIRAEFREDPESARWAVKDRCFEEEMMSLMSTIGSLVESTMAMYAAGSLGEAAEPTQ